MVEHWTPSTIAHTRAAPPRRIYYHPLSEQKLQQYARFFASWRQPKELKLATFVKKIFNFFQDFHFFLNTNRQILLPSFDIYIYIPSIIQVSNEY